MKYRILVFFLSCLVNNYASTMKGIVAPYQITNIELDASLKKNEALFVFRFQEWGEGTPCKAQIKASSNGKSTSIQPDNLGYFNYRPAPGKYKFQFFLSVDHEEVYTDSIEIKPGHRIEMVVNFVSSSFPVIMDKPVIYVYPPHTTPVNIQLEVKGALGFTYPSYNQGWNLVAEPNGVLHINNQDYKYLFWEGTTHLHPSEINWADGFMVEKKDLLSFLENTLTQMGLNSIEQQDFITYWYPLMSQHEKTYIHFMFNEVYDAYAHLTVTPQPDQLLRVYMLWQNAGEIKNLTLTPQEIPTFKREGFTVIEWGGSELKNSIPLTDL
jgi:hypothetical protein